MTGLITGAFGCIGASVIRGLPIPFPDALDDTRYQKNRS